MSQQPDNRFLTAPLPRIFALTALPMVVIMTMNGLLGVVDAAFLGHFVGPDAMAAVGIAFPVLMLTIALSTLVSAGMSSLFARQLGAGDTQAAASTFASAHGLALTIAAALIVLFLVGGWRFATGIAGPGSSVASMVWIFLAISIFATPVQFLLGLHADAWRNEGKAGLMALMSLGVTFANIVLNYLLIVIFDLGVAGSALGTALAQIAGLILLATLRGRIHGMLPLPVLLHRRWTGGWGRIVALGAPVSLGFIGMAMSAAVVVLALASSPDQAETIAAYGIVTRVFSFAFLPLMAIALAMQSVVGNNVGARLYHRSDKTLWIALSTAAIYGLTVQALLLSRGTAIGEIFVADPAVAATVGNLFGTMALLYLVSGPVFVLGLYFQAIGQPALAGLFTVVKPILLLPGSIATLFALFGPDGLWYAYPISDGLTAILALVVMTQALRRREDAGLGIAPSRA